MLERLIVFFSFLNLRRFFLLKKLFFIYVIPAKAEIHPEDLAMLEIDPRLRGDDS